MSYWNPETLRTLKRFRNTRVERPDGRVGVDVILHRTCICSTDGDSVTLRTGGWSTVTTKRRLNQIFEALGLNWHIYQQDWAWYVVTHEGCYSWDGSPVTFSKSTGALIPPCHGAVRVASPRN